MIFRDRMLKIRKNSNGVEILNNWTVKTDFRSENKQVQYRDIVFTKLKRDVLLRMPYKFEGIRFSKYTYQPYKFREEIKILE